MTDLKEYILSIGSSYGIVDPNFLFRVSQLLVNNQWYGCRPVGKDGKLMLEDDQAEKIGQNISAYCERYHLSSKDKADYLVSELASILPKTARMLTRYAKEKRLADKSLHYLSDFLLSYLPGELHESTDAEVSALMEDGYQVLSKIYGDLLADFANWMHKKEKTVYKNLYFMEKYSDDSDASSAYDPDYYLSILYHLYNSGYIEKKRYVRPRCCVEELRRHLAFLISALPVRAAEHRLRANSPSETYRHARKDTGRD